MNSKVRTNEKVFLVFLFLLIFSCATRSPPPYSNDETDKLPSDALAVKDLRNAFSRRSGKNSVWSGPCARQSGNRRAQYLELFLSEKGKKLPQNHIRNMRKKKLKTIRTAFMSSPFCWKKISPVKSGSWVSVTSDIPVLENSLGACHWKKLDTCGNGFDV